MARSLAFFARAHHHCRLPVRRVASWDTRAVPCSDWLSSWRRHLKFSSRPWAQTWALCHPMWYLLRRGSLSGQSSAAGCVPYAAVSWRRRDFCVHARLTGTGTRLAVVPQGRRLRVRSERDPHGACAFRCGVTPFLRGCISSPPQSKTRSCCSMQLFQSLEELGGDSNIPHILVGLSKLVGALGMSLGPSLGA